MLFASSFVSGLADAVSDSGSQVSTNIFGTTLQTFSPKSVTEELIMAFGDVGKSFSTVLAKDINMPPTVRVHAGSGIGILLMSDLTIPEKQ